MMPLINRIMELFGRILPAVKRILQLTNRIKPSISGIIIIHRDALLILECLVWRWCLWVCGCGSLFVRARHIMLTHVMVMSTAFSYSGFFWLVLLIEIVILVDMAPKRDFKAKCKTGDVDFEFKPLVCIQGGFQKTPSQSAPPSSKVCPW